MKKALLGSAGILLLIFVSVNAHADLYYSQPPLAASEYYVAGSNPGGVTPVAHVSSIEFKPTTSEHGASAADNFTLPSTDGITAYRITGITWWGFDTGTGTTPGPGFIFAIFGSNGEGYPGSSVGSSSVSLSGGDYGVSGVKEYSSSTSLVLDAGTKYWLNIYNTTTGTGWGWLEAAEQGDFAIHYTTDFGVFSPPNLAFKLTYAPVPIPSAAWLLGSGLIGLVLIRRRIRTR